MLNIYMGLSRLMVENDLGQRLSSYSLYGIVLGTSTVPLVRVYTVLAELHAFT